MNKPFKIPTIFALFLIAAILGSAGFITQSVRKSTNAAPESSPKNVQVTNISDSGFTITFETDQSIASALTTTDPAGKKLTHLDERHTSGTVQKFTMHSIPVRGLEPQNSYTLSILLGGKPYTVDELSPVTTAPKLESDTNGMPPIYGTVKSQDNAPADGALLFLKLENNSQTLSTVVKPSGSWIIPMNVIRTPSLTQLISRTNTDDKIDITVVYKGQITTIKTDIKNSTPVPTIITGQSRDITKELVNKTPPSGATPSPLASAFNAVLGVQKASTTSKTIGLLTPKDGGTVLIDPPQFSGIGIPGNIVTLLIGMKNPKTATTKVLPDGTWKFAPSGIVGQGKQKVTMTTLDDQQKPMSVTHEFEIMKSGVQVLGDATPSGIPTVIPTVSLSPTPSVYDMPIATPTPTIPDTATILPTNLLVIVGVIFLFGGLVVLAL